MCLLFLEAGAEDATRAHAHKGIFRRLNPGSPQSAGLKLNAAARKRLLESTKAESSVMALPESPSSPKGTMRCSSVQLVHAPVNAIWETLTTLTNYPKFVGGISRVEPYSKRRTLTGGQLFCAHYTLCVGPLYKVKYFVEHRHEPLQNSMVWQLDYSRSSDVYDSVGYWHVEPLDAERCIVYYTQDSLLPSWIPMPLKKSFTNAAMRACTGKLEPACQEAARSLSIIVETAMLAAAHAATCRCRSPPARGRPLGPRGEPSPRVCRREAAQRSRLAQSRRCHRLGPSRKAAQKRSGGALGKLGLRFRGGATACQPPALLRRALLRRAALAGGPALLGPAILAATGRPAPVSAAEPEAAVTLSDEEMAARVRRKQELLRQRQLNLVKGTDLPLDFNPEAGTNLRAKSIEQNLKESLEKQKEMKQRKTANKRDDMCEMLGRGC